MQRRVLGTTTSPDQAGKGGDASAPAGLEFAAAGCCLAEADDGCRPAVESAALLSPLLQAASIVAQTNPLADPSSPRRIYYDAMLTSDPPLGCLRRGARRLLPTWTTSSLS